MFAMKNPRNCCGVSSCAVQMSLVGCSDFCFKLAAFVKCTGKSFLYLLNGMVFTSMPGSTFTGISLMPYLVIIWSVEWNDVYLCDATSVGSFPSGLECSLDVM